MLFHFIVISDVCVSRLCVYCSLQVSRVFHIGEVGTHAGEINYDRYFGSIQLAKGPIIPLDWRLSTERLYDEDLARQIEKGHALSSPLEILNMPLFSTVSLWYQASSTHVCVHLFSLLVFAMVS